MAPTGRGGRRNTHRRNNPTSSSHPTTTKSLPPTLIIKILTHIDPKSLARFKCVSKSWYALITHPIFIKKHLHINTLSISTHVICNAYNTRNRDACDACIAGCNCNKVVSLLRLDKLPVTLLEIETGSNFSDGFPSKISFGDFSINMVLAGSVNGVVLVMNVGELNERFVGLWNPGVNMWKPIKVEGKGRFGDDVTCSAYGLGYDEGNDDIRIVRIVTAYVSRAEFFAKCKRARVEIYSVNRGCWEDVDGEVLFWPSQCNCQFIVKGVPYFLGDDVMPDDPASNLQNWILVKFNPCTGLFKKVQYPEHFRGIDTWATPFEYQDSVAVMVQSTPLSVEKHMIDMYVLDDDDTSWIKMYSIGPFPFLEFHQPRQCLKTGLIVLEDLLHDVPGPYLYDPKTNHVTSLTGIENLKPRWAVSYSHSESLVTIKGMESIRKNDKNKKTKPKKMNRTQLLSKVFELALHL